MPAGPVFSMPRICTLEPVKLVSPGSPIVALPLVTETTNSGARASEPPLLRVGERQIRDAAGARDRRHAQVVRDVAGRGGAGDGERRGIGRVLAAAGDHDVVAARRRAGEVELGEERRADLEGDLRSRRSAVPPPCGTRLTVVPAVNSAPWMVSVVVPELPAWAGLDAVTWSGSVLAESVNGLPLPEPVSPWTRM